jgi:predicted ribosomally synthesized peptide with nif11-like leader
MSEDQLNAFLEVAQADSVLQEQLQAAADPDAVVAIAKEAGFNLTKGDLIRYQARQVLELTDEELEGAAGGARKQTEGANRWSCLGGSCAVIC